MKLGASIDNSACFCAVTVSSKSSSALRLAFQVVGRIRWQCGQGSRQRVYTPDPAFKPLNRQIKYNKGRGRRVVPLIIIDWMGQINCQCQYIPTEEFDPFKRNHSLHNIPSRALEPRTQVTRMTLKNGPMTIDIRLGEYSRSTFGSGQECEQRPQHLNGNTFKLQLRIRSRCVYMRDCGMGLGAFLLKRKIVRRADGTQMLINACDKWLLLKITHAEQIHYSLYNNHSSTSKVLGKKEEHEIDLGVEKLLLRRDQEGKNYVMRRGDRREMWVWLGQERRVRINDVVRLGFEFYEIDSISSHFDTLKKQ